MFKNGQTSKTPNVFALMSSSKSSLPFSFVNILDNTIKALDGKGDAIPSNIQRLSCILIGCILSGKVYKQTKLQRMLLLYS